MLRIYAIFLCNYINAQISRREGKHVNGSTAAAMVVLSALSKKSLPANFSLQMKYDLNALQTKHHDKAS